MVGKHNIPFNSPARVSSFIDMYCEYMDDLLRKPSENKGRKEEFEYIPGKGNFMKKDYYEKKKQIWNLKTSILTKWIK